MPGGHVEQLPDPITLQYVPAEQDMHALELTSTNVPAGQVEAVYKHDDDPVTENVPDGHLMHSKEPLASV